MLLLGLAIVGYGALIPLTIFSDFRPWLWLSLLVVSALFLYLPVRTLFQTPITRTRWIIIAIAAFPTAWFLLGLGGAAISTWPWWLWLGTIPPVAFVFLVPARGAFSGSNVRRRYAIMGAAGLVAVFILVGLGMAGFREWQEWQWQRSFNTASASAGAVNSGVPSAQGNAGNAGNAVNAAGAAGGAAVAVPVCGQPTGFRASTTSTFPDREIFFEWLEPATTGFPVTGYQVEMRAMNDAGNYTDWQSGDNFATGAAETSRQNPVSSDVDGATFQFRVHALCGAAASEPSEIVTHTFPVPVCGQPINFRHGNFNDAERSITYSWDAPGGGDLPVTGYQTEWRELLSDGSYGSWTLRDALGASETHQYLGSHSPEYDGRTYENRVYAVCDGIYSEPSDVVAYTVPAMPMLPANTALPEPTAPPPATSTPEPTAEALAPPEPVLTVWPSEAYPGDVVTVQLSGFPPYTLVQEVSIWGVDLLGGRVVNTDPGGNAAIDGVSVPDLSNGDYEVLAIVGGAPVIGQVTVLTIPPTPTPPPYPDPALLAQRGPQPSELVRAPGVSQYVSGCFVGGEPRQQHWIYLADRPSATLESAWSPILLEFSKSIPKEELREVIPGKCYYVGPITYQTDESVDRCPGSVYSTGCSSSEMNSTSFQVYVTEGTLREITETPRFGN